MAPTDEVHWNPGGAHAELAGAVSAVTAIADVATGLTGQTPTSGGASLLDAALVASVAQVKALTAADGQAMLAAAQSLNSAGTTAIDTATSTEGQNQENLTEPGRSTSATGVQQPVPA